MPPTPMLSMSTKQLIRWPSIGKGGGPSNCTAARRDDEPPVSTVAASRTAEPGPVADRLDPPGSVTSDRSALGSGSKSDIEWLIRDFGENSPQDFRVAREGRRRRGQTGACNRFGPSSL